MRDRFHNQLALDLDHSGKQHPPQPAPEELLKALRVSANAIGGAVLSRIGPTFGIRPGFADMP
jgi:hypothetical protein